MKYLIVVLAILFMAGCGDPDPVEKEKTLMESMEGAAEQMVEKVNKEMEEGK